MDLYNFQGQPILHYSSSIILNEDEVKNINNINYIKNDKNYISKDKYILNSNEFSRIKDMFDYGVNHFMKNILEIDHKLKILNSWATLNKENDYHPLHDHQNVFLSICYYPQVENCSINFEFKKSIIQENFNFTYNRISPNVFNSNVYSIPLKSNDIVIFPGWIFHNSSSNNSKNDKIMLAANYFLKGGFGEDESVGKLKI